MFIRSFFLITIMLISSTSLVMADKLEDFEKSIKESRSKETCNAIPYSKLRKDCGQVSVNTKKYCKSRNTGKCIKGKKSELQQQEYKERKYLKTLQREKKNLKSEISKEKDKSKNKFLKEKLTLLEKQIKDSQKKLKNNKASQHEYEIIVEEQAEKIEKCIFYRKAAMNIFDKAGNKVKSEKGEAILSLARELRNSYYASRKEHIKQIKNKESSLKRCISER